MQIWKAMRIKWVFEYVKVREKNRGVKRRNGAKGNRVLCICGMKREDVCCALHWIDIDLKVG